MEFLRTLAELRTPFWDTVMLYVTKLGEETLFIVVMCTLFWCVSKRLAYGMGTAFMMSSLAVQGLKITCRIDRPWILDPNFAAVQEAVPHATGYSFPSGHTQTATSMYGSLALMLKNAWAKLGCIALFLLVGFSRMYLGVHTPADVLVGMGISLLFVVAVVMFYRKDGSSNSATTTLAIVIALFGLAVLAQALLLHSDGLIDYKYTSDSCKTVGAAFGFAIGYFIERRYINFSTKTDRLWKQAVKLVIGIAGVLAIKAGVKLLGATLVIDTVRYALMILWVVVLWPLVIKRFIQSDEDEKEPVAIG